MRSKVALSEFYGDELAKERARDCASEHDYKDYHKDRLSFTYALCCRLKPDRATKVLDVGRSRLSSLLATYYNNVSTIGFPVDVSEDNTLKQHYIYDLNSAADGREADVDQSFDIITFAETIEHLHVAPELILFALARLLTQDGILVCQTPNAVALHRRLSMLRGLNPYERLRIDGFNPGHIREYTRAELIDIGKRAGLQAIHHEFKEYFGFQGSALRKAAIGLLKGISFLVPSFSRGQTIVYRLE